MRVKALTALNVDGVHVPEGEEVTLPADRAKAAIEAGIAAEVKKSGPDTKEEKKFE